MPANALDTDLYQITMMAGYEAAHANVRATFELFVRNLPPNRAFLVAAGLEQALDFLESLRFTPRQIAWLRESSYFRTVPDAFSKRLATLRLTGDVWAVPEGTPVFAYEPLLRVTAPLAEAQLVETSLRPNWFVGIRTPWTLSSKESWVRTHRAGGWLFVAMGLLIMGTALIRTHAVVIVVWAASGAGLIALVVSSYVVWRRDPDKVPPAGTTPAEP